MVQPKYFYNENGPVLGTVSAPIIYRDGYAFKDLEGTGELLPYEDWRLSDTVRAQDLAKRLSIEEIAGLMLYSAHQAIPGDAHLPGTKPPTYDGKIFAESHADSWDLTDEQKHFLEKDHLRHVLVFKIASAEIAAKWNNEAQAFAEALPHGIPVNTSSDPRHGAGTAAAEFKSSASDTSKWPEGLGMAAAFDPELTRRFGEIAAKEYRAMGICTALSPQVDIGSEPRWMRVSDTFGCDPQLVTDLSKAYCEGMQTTKGELDGWGKDSVVAMAKHWPGGGTGEGGRDAHYPFGQFAVYPGNNQQEHLKPFLEGAFHLDGGTEMAGAVMPYYTVSWNYDTKYGENTGNSYSYYIIHDLLREKYGYDNVVCTDWDVTHNPLPKINSFSPRCYGQFQLTEAERHLKIIENGVDQFGGNNEARPIIEAYALGCRKYGEETMRARMERSAVRLLRGIFRLGLFENPYLDAEESRRTVGNEDFCAAGYEAQLKSVVMLKNNGVLPIASTGEWDRSKDNTTDHRVDQPTDQGRARRKVYIPDRHIDDTVAFFRLPIPPQDIKPADSALTEKYYESVPAPEDADFAIVFIDSPICDPYSDEDLENGGNGYLPVTLQYEPYTADTAREVSIAGGDPRESFTNRSYKGKTNRISNYQDLENVRKTRQLMGAKPVIVVIHMKNPCILSEIEPYADAILVDFGVQQQALFDLISGKAEPSALLPVQLPADMETVERHCEDLPHDMKPYTDTCGHTYDFGFGMNWSGVIKDARTAKYVR